MIKKLSKENGKIVEAIRQKALENGVCAYIVGGVVRDLFLNKEIKDIDFLMEGSAIDFAKKSGFKIKSEHKDFDTVKVEIENSEIDIASTRLEDYPVCGCLPVLKKVGVKIEEDLKRRDFTVNSIAINILNNKIIDPYNGEKDIKAGVLKILHNKSFQDDPTRILRGLDFKYRFNFDFDENTKKLMLETPKSYNRTGLSIDRIYLTLNKIFSNSADKILSDIIDFEIYKIWTNSIGIKKGEIASLERVIEKFKIKDKSKIYIMALENCPYVKAPMKDDFEVFEFFKKFSELQLAFYYFKTKDENALKYLEIKDIKPLISGKTLIENGFSRGEIIGKILNSILKEKILNKNSLNSIEDEIDFAIKNFG